VKRTKRVENRQEHVPTRERALELAETLLGERGYLGLSMETIAEGIGIRKASLYYHFPDGKEEMIVEVTERVLRRAEQKIMQARRSSPTAKAQLEAILKLEFTTEHHIQTMLKDAERFMGKTHQAGIAAGFMKHMFSPLQQVFVQGITRGEFRKHDTALATWLLLNLISKISEGNLLSKHTNEEVLDLFMNGICKS
jgi:AcrR family transcriptional regulator